VVVTLLADGGHERTGEDAATVFVVGVFRVELHFRRTTFCLVLLTTHFVVQVGQILPLSIATALRVSLATGLLQRMVLDGVVVLAALRLLGEVEAAGLEFGVVVAVHWLVHTWLVAHLAFGGVSEFIQGTAFGLVLVSFVLDDVLAWLDLLTESGVSVLIFIVHDLATVLVVVTLSDLHVAIGVEEDLVTAISELGSVDQFGQDFLTLHHGRRVRMFTESHSHVFRTTGLPGVQVFRLHFLLSHWDFTIFPE